MEKIVVNLQTGVTTTVPFTPTEVAEYAARRAVEDAEKAANAGKKSVEERLAALEAKVFP